jgi:hypothetical protein
MSSPTPPTPPVSASPENKPKNSSHKRKLILVLVGLVVIAYFLRDSQETESDSSKEATPSTSIPYKPTTTISTTTTTTLPPYTDEEYVLAAERMMVKNDAVVGTRWILSKSTPKYSNEDFFHIYVVGSQTAFRGLRFQARYSGSDWVFFEKIIINVDGKMFYLDFSYDEVDRDNGSGDVWETILIEPSAEDILMLKLIADSKSTIVRFQGEDDKDDRELTAKEKKAISDVFVVWDGYQRGKIAWNP